MTMPPLPSRLAFKEQPIFPPLLLAPMAGVTHSAFRRLIASFGGYGALYTEMIPVSAPAAAFMPASALTRRRDVEGKVVYQLVITGETPVEHAVDKIAALHPFAIDINLGCPAPMIKRKGGGCALFDDAPRLRQVLESVRSRWSGPLTVKCRLGHESDHWQELFLERLELFRSASVDALCVHPRFFHEKLKRKARHNTFAWIRQHWSLPLIGNGDMIDGTALELLHRGECDGLMIGREAVRRPWIFRELCGERVDIDFRVLWDEFYRFTLEDFPPERALGRIKEFTVYFADNFFFGHELFRRINSATDCTMLQKRVHEFLDTDPRIQQR
jgi:tRNA-dihydrouridine synthase